MNKERLGSLLLGLGVGALVGAGITMLTTPWTGRETRSRLRGVVEDSGEAIKRGYTTAKERAREMTARS